MAIAVKRYDRSRAVEYATTWALGRNPLFFDFGDQGGNCTNFVSQAILAGSCVMDYTDIFGWYYISTDDRAPAWTGVEFLYDYLVGAGDFYPTESRPGPFGKEVNVSEVTVGDVVQLGNSSGDYYHTLIITDIKNGVIYVSANTDNALNRRLSSYRFRSVRFIRIEGVNVYIPDEDCFNALINGEALPNPMI